MPSTHNFGDELVHLIDEVEHFILLRWQIQELRTQYNIQMAENNDNRPLKDFVFPSQEEPQSSIVNPTI